jgi:hypothetical protein
MALKGNPADWSRSDRQGVIYAALAEQGSHVHVSGTIRSDDGKSKRKCPTCRAAARTLFQQVGEPPLIFRSEGVVLGKGTKRWERFMNTVGEIHAYVAAGSWTSEAPEAPEAPTPSPEPSEAPEAPPTAVKVPFTATGAMQEAAEELYAAIQHRRAFVRGRKGMESLDSMRVVIEGVKALKLGLPVAALISAIEAPWTAETGRPLLT